MNLINNYLIIFIMKCQLGGWGGKQECNESEPISALNIPVRSNSRELRPKFSPNYYNTCYEFNTTFYYILGLTTKMNDMHNNEFNKQLLNNIYNEMPPMLLSSPPTLIWFHSTQSSFILCKSC